MIVAQIGLGFGILTQSSYSVVVFMSVATTIVAPPLIKMQYKRRLDTKTLDFEEEILRVG
jgi:Kef-type K+ transport system membrane component KefB